MNLPKLFAVLKRNVKNADHDTRFFCFLGIADVFNENSFASVKEHDAVMWKLWNIAFAASTPAKKR